MKLKGIIDYDTINYKEPCLTLLFGVCDFKCDRVNGCQVCQNSKLAAEPNIYVSEYTIWGLYKQNPLTKGFCCQGLEPFDSESSLLDFIDFIRAGMKCDDPIIIYTGYNKNEIQCLDILNNYSNIIIKYGRYIMGQQPHYDKVLGVKLASDNQYAEKIT